MAVRRPARVAQTAWEPPPAVSLPALTTEAQRDSGLLAPSTPASPPAAEWGSERAERAIPQAVVQRRPERQGRRLWALHYLQQVEERLDLLEQEAEPLLLLEHLILQMAQALVLPVIHLDLVDEELRPPAHAELAVL